MKKILLWVGIGLVTIVVLAVAGWYFFLKSDPEPPAAIKDTPLQTQAPTTTGGNADPPSTSAISGTYAVKPGNTDNFVGYRVTEKLVVNVVQTTATGRTDNVTGTFAIDGTTVQDVTVSADLRDLKSDSGF